MILSPTRSTAATTEASVAEMLKRARALDSAGDSASPQVPAKPLVLFGAGPLAHMTLAHLRRLEMIPVAVADNNQRRWGGFLEGIPILSPDEARRRYGERARFIVTVYNGSAVRRQLRELGCKDVQHFADLYFEFPNEFLPYCGLAPRRVILDDERDVLRAASVWSDERSLREYQAQLAWRLRLPDSQMPAHDPAAECYFPQDMFSLLSEEVLFDCGAFDGDSVMQYLRRRPAAGSPRILALEPDQNSFGRLAGFVEGLPSDLAQRVRIEPWAVAERSGEVQFSALGSVRSGVTQSGGETVAAVGIDDIELVPTLIKMDVEGFELAALKGGAKTIRRELPVLAISLYHHAADLWQIPNYLKALAPDYRLLLRRYAEDCWELVLYAVPISRLLAAAARPHKDDVYES